ncbi:DUF1549 and DUF1553 domain-containing protein [Tautonia sociabilis]|uniref:DUF1553 domain-containing protein n=1 Tax=Tautonia sociabilis TaxID=2080755 RepID=A0A432MD99_9BACT|nr:DUF1549 and DUF1553 domain-containing protein [Tautonia sociabilis]RUL81854.1 DUF1553 domain-containing protein [Tautonia sociabilis]
MSRLRILILILILGMIPLGAFAASASAPPPAAGDPDRGPGEASTPGGITSSAPDPYALAEAIDRRIGDRLEEASVEPAPLADDAEFLRRVWLDIAGSIPPASEVRSFLLDDDPQKRRKIVDRLLDSPGYVRNMSMQWRNLMIPEAEGDQQVGFAAIGFEPWLRQQFAEGVGYDAMVRELLTVPLGDGQQANRLFSGEEPEPSPIGFVAAKAGDPGALAAGTSRLFLGIRLECAQCHDHPFATWSRDEFWGLAAFFSGLDRQSPEMAIFQGREIPGRTEIAIPETGRVAQATFLDGTRPRWRYADETRSVLAKWITSPENPYFARAAANRLWAQFFGRGLVDPVDEMGPINQPSHPELLDELALRFAQSGFDPRFLIRAITASDTYQRTSAGYAPGQDVPELFARMPVRGLSPEQLYESLIQASGLEREEPLPPFVFGGTSPRKDLMDRFAEDGTSPTERRSTILQALTLMNGPLVNTALNPEGSGTLAAVADSYFLSTREKVEALYLAAFSRLPRDEELERLARYVDRGGPTLDPKRALADVFWALLNSPEFSFNH